ncbi:MAG: XdhC family protein [Pseudomonadota bacterium]
MIAAPNLDPSLAEAVTALEAEETPFAFATVVRTAGSTAAKPGTKALLSAEGEIIGGWLGGGCAKAAVRRATLEALADGQPKLISIAPEEELNKGGMEPGQERDGVRYVRNGCPSKGTIDIFIEPCLPAPELIVYGASPVARALSTLPQGFQWDIRVQEAVAPLPDSQRRRFILIATQGQGDLNALRSALATEADYVGFIGSARKFAALSAKLLEEGVPADRLEAVRAPAGLPIGAVTPEEIALSALAELTQVRRDKMRARDA